MTKDGDGKPSSKLSGVLWWWARIEGELATTSLEFEYLHRKTQCKMLIANIRARFHLALTGGNLTAQSTGTYRGIGGGIQIPEM